MAVLPLNITRTQRPALIQGSEVQSQSGCPLGKASSSTWFNVSGGRLDAGSLPNTSTYKGKPRQSAASWHKKLHEFALTFCHFWYNCGAVPAVRPRQYPVPIPFDPLCLLQKPWSFPHFSCQDAHGLWSCDCSHRL